MASKVRTVKSNLLGYPVVVGVVEQMKDSLNLIRYAVNSDGNPLIDHLLDLLCANATKSKRINQSQLSTGDLTREIKKDYTLFRKLKYLLRFEFQIYNFAKEIHKRQVQYVIEHQQ